MTVHKGRPVGSISVLPYPALPGTKQRYKKTLTPKQREFVDHLMQDPKFDVRKAAILAGYSKSCARVMAFKLLRKRQVQEYLAIRMRRREEESLVTNRQILDEVDTLALRDPIDLCDKETGLIIVDDLRKIPENIRRCIDQIEVTQKVDKLGRPVGQKVKLKLVSKAQALELAMKHRGLLAPIKVETKQSIDWDSLVDDGSTETDPVEEAIEIVARKKASTRKWMEREEPAPVEDEDQEEEDTDDEDE